MAIRRCNVVAKYNDLIGYRSSHYLQSCSLHRCDKHVFFFFVKIEIEIDKHTFINVALYCNVARD